MVGTSDLALEVCVQQPLAHMSYFASLDNEPSPMLLLSLNPTYIRGLRALMNYNLVQGCEAML